MHGPRRSFHAKPAQHFGAGWASYPDVLTDQSLAGRGAAVSQPLPSPRVIPVIPDDGLRPIWAVHGGRCETLLPTALPLPMDNRLKNPATHYDAAWKSAMDAFLQPFIELMFPDLARQIDWSVEPLSLDTELQPLLPESSSGEMRADRLVEVTWLKGGVGLVLLHVEVQAQRDPNLALRMFRYHYRIFDRFGRHPVSLVVLADDEMGWRPGPYQQGLGGSGIRFDYATCKMADLDLGPWLAQRNPVAVLIKAHRWAQQTRGDVEARRLRKLELVRALLEFGLTREEAIRSLYVVNWLLALPDAAELVFREDVKRMEADMHDKLRSPYDTIVWREGREEGREEGRMEGLQRGNLAGRCSAAREFLEELVEERFGRCDAALKRSIAAISAESELKRLARIAARASQIEEFERELQKV